MNRLFKESSHRPEHILGGHFQPLLYSDNGVMREREMQQIYCIRGCCRSWSEFPGKAPSNDNKLHSTASTLHLPVKLFTIFTHADRLVSLKSLLAFNLACVQKSGGVCRFNGLPLYNKGDFIWLTPTIARQFASATKGISRAPCAFCSIQIIRDNPSLHRKTTVWWPKQAVLLLFAFILTSMFFFQYLWSSDCLPCWTYF